MSGEHLTDDHLAVLQGRLERGEPIARPVENPDAPAAIRRRHARKDSSAVKERRTGHRKRQDSDARYTEHGDEIEWGDEWLVVDQYLRTKPGTAAASAALKKWRREWRCK